MALLRYFRSEKGPDQELDPHGPSSRHVPPTVITSVNKELRNKQKAEENTQR